MCSIVNSRRGKIILIYSMFLIIGSNAKKSQTHAHTQSDKIEDEEIGLINNPSQEDKSHSQSAQSVYSQMYPSYPSSSSSSSLNSNNNYYPQYANWHDSLYYNKYPQRSIGKGNIVP